MVITSEVENVDNWLANRVERHATILQFAENIVEYANAEASNVVALTFDIVDEKKMNELKEQLKEELKEKLKDELKEELKEETERGN